uniref:Thioredoxin domain-containing protein n=1 Tax=Heterorhabditis bacteriophora TaxID=37862 RepID=A0A1I7WHH3_HETBA
MVDRYTSMVTTRSYGRVVTNVRTKEELKKNRTLSFNLCGLEKTIQLPSLSIPISNDCAEASGPCIDQAFFVARPAFESGFRAAIDAVMSTLSLLAFAKRTNQRTALEKTPAKGYDKLISDNNCRVDQRVRGQDIFSISVSAVIDNFTTEKFIKYVKFTNVFSFQIQVIFRMRFVFCATLFCFVIASKKLDKKDLSNGFRSEIKWVEWSKATGVAKDLNKPIFFLIHKTWCGACKGLQREFNSSPNADDLIKLSENFVMVNVEDNEEPDDIKYAPDGGYIPRILFLASQLLVLIIFQLIFTHSDTDGNPLMVNNEKKYKNNKYFYPLVPQVIQGMERALQEFEAVSKEQKVNVKKQKEIGTITNLKITFLVIDKENMNTKEDDDIGKEMKKDKKSKSEDRSQKKDSGKDMKINKEMEDEEEVKKDMEKKDVKKDKKEQKSKKNMKDMEKKNDIKDDKKDKKSRAKEMRKGRRMRTITRIEQARRLKIRSKRKIRKKKRENKPRVAEKIISDKLRYTLVKLIITVKMTQNNLSVLLKYFRFFRALNQGARPEQTEYTEFTIDMTTKVDSCVEISSAQISSKEVRQLIIYFTKIPLH